MLRLGQQQRLQLRVAVLLDDEHVLVLLEELPHLLAERERADAAVVGMDALGGQPVERLRRSRRRSCRRRRRPAPRLCASGESRARARAWPPSATSSRADRRLAGTPRSPRCSRRTGCGPSRARSTRRAGARPAACAAGYRRRRRRRSDETPSPPRARSADSTLPRSGRYAGSQSRSRHIQSFMPMSRSDMHDDRRLQPVREIERRDGELEALARIAREQQHVLRVAVRRIGRRQQVGLLRARRHAGRRADALHVEQHGRQLREIREAQELAHQRQAGAARRRERTRAVPRRAEHDADRGELVFGLHDAVAPLAGLRILAVALAERLERVHQRRRRRDRVPGADRRARIHAAQGRGRIAVDHDVAGRLVQRLRRAAAAGTSRCARAYS